MKIGVPKEIKPQENRVGATPGTVAQLVAAGHEVFVETTAGAGIGVTDEAYTKVGANIQHQPLGPQLRLGHVSTAVRQHLPEDLWK